MPPSTRKLHILLADDSEVIRHILTTLLTTFGHRVTAVADGAEAVERFTQQACDLVLLDLVMPNMDGLEATRRIKTLAEQQKRWAPILIISAASDQDKVVTCLAQGAEDFLHKPVHADLLKAKIDAYARSIDTYHRLLESEQRARAISEGVVDAIITIDEQGAVLSCNRATTRLFGYNREEIVGRNVKMLMPPPYHDAHDGYLSRYLQTGEPHVIGLAGREVRGRRKDGALMDLRLGVSEMNLPGEQRVFVGVLSDITLRKTHENHLRQNAEELTRLHKEITADMDTANGVMDRLIFKEGLADEQLRHHVAPASQFSGDLIAAIRAPNDVLYVMAADATGHGLAAAITLLPALWVFYGMARKNATVAEIAAEINTRLKETVPLGRFVAAHIASINNPARTVRLWSGGMPPAYLVKGDDGVCELRSPHLALGILPAGQFDPSTEVIEWTPGDQLFFCSDGLTEAQDEFGTMFGQDRLDRLLRETERPTLFSNVVAAVERHLGGQSAGDDVSLLGVSLP